MKRILIGLSALFLLGGGAMAQKVTVADVEAVPGETVSFSLSLSEGRADSYTALKFDVQFPAEGFTTTGAYTVSSAWPGASAVVGDVDASGLAIIPFASANEIAGAEVDNLVTVSFKVDESVAIDSYDVTLKNIMFEYGMTGKDYAPDVTFTVRVVSSHVLVLDEESTEAPEAVENIKVQVKRTILPNQWSTICLPFAMTEAQVKEAFGNDVKLGDFNGYDVEDDGNTIRVKFNTATAIEANHPYIIKVSAAVSEFTVDGVDIDPQEAEINKGTSRKPKAFIGNYVAKTNVPNGCLVLSGNNFWYSVGTTKIKAFRAYFDFFDLLPDFEDNYAEAPMYISFDSNTTGIDATLGNSEIVNGEERYYNLNGQRVEKPKKGMYIINNKKVVVK
jgi:hypothetical protein